MSAPTARTADPDTAKDAGVMAADARRTLRDECLAALRVHGPMTDHELAAVVDCAGQTSAGKRRLELERAGLVVLVHGADGKPLRRRTPSGATACVWQAVA